MGERLALTLRDEMPHHVRAWRVKRVVWVIMALFVCAGLAGLLGSGPLSSDTLRNESGLELTYDKIARFESPSHLELVIPPGKESVSVAVSGGFWDQVEIERIEPTPVEMALVDDTHVWTFRRLDSHEKSKIRVMFRPLHYGRTKAEITVRRFGTFKIRPFFLP